MVDWRFACILSFCQCLRQKNSLVIYVFGVSLEVCVLLSMISVSLGVMTMPGRKMFHVISFVKYNSNMYNTKLIMVIIDDGFNMFCCSK